MAEKFDNHKSFLLNYDNLTVKRKFIFMNEMGLFKTINLSAIPGGDRGDVSWYTHSVSKRPSPNRIAENRSDHLVGDRFRLVKT